MTLTATVVDVTDNGDGTYDVRWAADHLENDEIDEVVWGNATMDVEVSPGDTITVTI